jgi:hypothetical protein
MWVKGKDMIDTIRVSSEPSQVLACLLVEYPYPIVGAGGQHAAVHLHCVIYGAVVRTFEEHLALREMPFLYSVVEQPA